MSSYSPNEIMNIAVDKGIEKANMSLLKMALLGFLGGAYISLGYLAYIRVSAGLPVEWGTLPHFIGASVFPIGLILILLAGGELITGNMMAVAASWFAKKVSFKSLLKNWGLITLFNLIGALFVAYFFGHVIGLTEGAYLEKTVATAQGKVDAAFFEAFISAIGCNWLVGLGVWLSFGTKDFAGKIFAIWFPIMIFVLIGFQHVVANFFIIPAAIFAGELSWLAFLQNAVPVWLGNALGGAILVGAIYVYAFKPQKQAEDAPQNVQKVGRKADAS